MAIAVYHRVLESPMQAQDILAIYNNPAAIGIFSRSMMEDILKNPTKHVIKPAIFALLSKGPEAYELGRCTFCAITGTQTQEAFPDAMYQLVVTVRDKAKGGGAHILIIYLN